jgi:pimeloyl-ACP methyl ester carboxylesterase
MTMDQPARTSSVSVTTTVGPLTVQVTGSGPPALLWHSLFVDSTTWDRLRPQLAAERRLVLVDGPNHGANPRRTTPFSLDDCVRASREILDQLGIDDPVDWLGNAWGGHVGILFAAAHPDRCRTVLAVGAPIHPLTPPERRRVRMLAALYRVAGPRPVRRPLVDALLGPATRAEDPDGAAIVARAFTRAGRPGMYDAVRWLSLSRPDLTPVLDQLRTPTLLVTGQDDPMWTIPAARAAAAHLRHGTMTVLPGAGHIGPVLHRTPAAAELITAFWRDPDGTIAAQRADRLLDVAAVDQPDRHGRQRGWPGEWPARAAS